MSDWKTAIHNFAKTIKQEAPKKSEACPASAPFKPAGAPVSACKSTKRSQKLLAKRLKKKARALASHLRKLGVASGWKTEAGAAKKVSSDRHVWKSASKNNSSVIQIERVLTTKLKKAVKRGGGDPGEIV